MPKDAAGIKKAMSWNYAFFVAACMVIATSVITMLELLMEFAPFQFISQVYLVMFGILMLILDWPFQEHTMRPHRVHIYKFLLFMTRFVGRGVWYLFLGTMVFASLWDLDVSPFLGIVLGGYICVLGIVAIVFGLKLSMKLEKCRKLLMQDSRYHDPKRICPPHGMAPLAFSEMCQSVGATEYKWTETELNYIMTGLNHHPDHPEVIIFSDFCYWFQEGRMAIL